MTGVFMKGYSSPRPLVTKLSVTSVLQSRYQYISLTLDLFQNYPELFKTTATTLIYILNININYKPEVIYQMFETLLTSSPILGQKEAENILENSLGSEEYVQTESMICLFAWYLQHNKSFKIFEPSMKGIKLAFDTFENNREVYYKGKKYNLNDFASLAVDCNGDSILEFMMYYNYIATFFINGRPYKFYDEIGSESVPNRLFADINSYFGQFYNTILKELQLKVSKNGAAEWYRVLGKEPGFQKMLNKMLDLGSIIKLRDTEMNKSDKLLDDCFRDQNVLTDSFLDECYKRNMDKLLEILIEKNPTKMLLDKFPKTVPKFLECNIRELMLMTEYCVSGSDKGFMIDENLNYRPVDGAEETKNKLLGRQTFKHSLNSVASSLKLPFNDSDIILKLHTEFIKRRIIEEKHSFLDTPDISSGVIEEIKLDERELEKYTGVMLDMFVHGMWKMSSAEMDILVTGLLDKSSKFRDDIDNILALENIIKKCYNHPSAGIIGAYKLSFLHTALLEHLNTSGLESFNFGRWSTAKEADIFRIKKMFDVMVSIGYVKTNEYARFVNISLADFDKYLTKSILQVPYIRGNVDQSDIFSIGGTELYDSMLDPNPFNRGYKFISQMFGTNSSIERFHNFAKNFSDVSSINLIAGASNENTVMDILQAYANKHRNEGAKCLSDYLIDTDLVVELKNPIGWTGLKQGDRYIFDYILEYAFKQIPGSYIEDVFMSRQLKLEGELIPGELLTNGMKYENRDVPVLMGTSGDLFNLPVYKYVSEWKDVHLNFVYPVGYKLLKFDISSSVREKNMSVFVFTNSKLDTMFNLYDVSN